MAHQTERGENRRTGTVVVEAHHAAIRGFEKYVSDVQGSLSLAFNLKRNSAPHDHADRGTRIHVHVIWRKGNLGPLVPLFLKMAVTGAKKWRAKRNGKTRRTMETTGA